MRVRVRVRVSVSVRARVRDRVRVRVRVRARVRVHSKCSSTTEGKSYSSLLPVFVLFDLLVCLVLREDKTRQGITPPK